MIQGPRRRSFTFTTHQHTYERNRALVTNNTSHTFTLASFSCSRGETLFIVVHSVVMAPTRTCKNVVHSILICMKTS
jgi:hypothetical protein